MDEKTWGSVEFNDFFKITQLVCWLIANSVYETGVPDRNQGEEWLHLEFLGRKFSQRNSRWEWIRHPKWAWIRSTAPGGQWAPRSSLIVRLLFILNSSTAPLVSSCFLDLSVALTNAHNSVISRNFPLKVCDIIHRIRGNHPYLAWSQTLEN